MRTIALLLVGALSLAPLHAIAQQASAKSVVESFASLDANGARLESGPNDPIWKLTADDGESPVQPVVLIDSFKVVGESVGKSVVVRYAVKGVVKDGGGPVTYLPGKRVEQATFTLVPGDDGTAKISERKLRVSPHVTTAAYLQHLDKLLALYDPAKDKGDPRYRSLLHLRDVLQKTAKPGK